MNQEIYADLPVVVALDPDVFVQMADEGERAALRGMDQASTKEAVETFGRNGLPERFLNLVWKRA